VSTTNTLFSKEAAVIDINLTWIHQQLLALG